MNYWWVVPAAGIGQRMQADRPKQYLELAGRTLLATTLLRCHQLLPQARLVLALHPDDRWWPACRAELEQAAPELDLMTTQGGAERADSVLAALDYLQPHAAAEDWVLVHDAARPCLDAADLKRLLQQASPIGGLLACPLADTLKQATAQQTVARTLDRRHLWQALTPQMFPYQALRCALQRALAAGATLTDEASALEWSGLEPQLVIGRRDNIKITHPEDLALAEFLLAQQKDRSCE
ncbi:2-C-methyl-D-erythritol 4-phosphate cytidylyltransferase [Marinospirillum sp. MEB164]|uniref:2-C-methyl-D-erythritol 4-phosphate cytidylyltransferase n=1 Tax=Marinospirillum alkalitolerans TaxID=3123374 RepID=A0ABW8PUF2_9GAMM